MLNVIPILFNIMLVYSFLTSCANFVYGDSTFSLTEIKEFQIGELNKLILNRNANSITRLEFTDLTDKVVDLPLNDGKIRVLNFWALWCAPCRREMASLNDLKAFIKSDNFEIITVASGRNSVSKINDFFTEGKLLHLRSLRDPKGKISNSLGIIGLPTTLVISTKGTEIGRVIGDINWASEESKKLFSFLLEK